MPNVDEDDGNVLPILCGSTLQRRRQSWTFLCNCVRCCCRNDCTKSRAWWISSSCVVVRPHATRSQPRSCYNCTQYCWYFKQERRIKISDTGISGAWNTGLPLSSHCEINRYFSDSLWHSYPSCGHPFHMYQYAKHACKMLLNTGITPNMMLTINSSPWQNFSPDISIHISQVSDISLTVVKFPGIFRFPYKW